MKHVRIKTFYTPMQALEPGETGDFSRSPQKPRLLMEFLAGRGLADYLKVVGDFAPFTDDDFRVAIPAEHCGSLLCGSSTAGQFQRLELDVGELADTVRYTNASLYQAIHAAIARPQQVTFSPTSGFHHARPKAGVASARSAVR